MTPIDLMLNTIEEILKSKRGKLIKNSSPLNDIDSTFASSGKKLMIDFSMDRFLKPKKNLEVGQFHKQVEFSHDRGTYVFS